MDFFEFSIKMEKDAEELYRSLADRVNTPGIKKVLNMLADDEVRHRINIEKLQKKAGHSPMEGSAVKIKTVFEELKADFKDEKLPEDVVEDYKKALEIETKGMDFYKEQFEKAEEGEVKSLFESLMKQESYHKKTVENLIEMVRKPEWWVEDAEFNPMGDNYY